MTAYIPLATTTLGANASSITFGSIPTTGYRDLELVVEGTVSADSNLLLRFNGDSGNNYAYLGYNGNGSSNGTHGVASTVCRVDSNIPPQVGQRFYLRVTILDAFASKGAGRNGISRYGNSSRGTGASAIYWNNGDPITSVGLFASLAAGTSLSLYGIVGTL